MVAPSLHTNSDNSSNDDDRKHNSHSDSNLRSCGHTRVIAGAVWVRTTTKSEQVALVMVENVVNSAFVGTAAARVQSTAAFLIKAILERLKVISLTLRGHCGGKASRLCAYGFAHTYFFWIVTGGVAWSIGRGEPFHTRAIVVSKGKVTIKTRFAVKDNITIFLWLTAGTSLRNRKVINAHPHAAHSSATN